MEKEVEMSAKQEQIHDLLFNRDISWQEIIYDLINTDQLDPWDVDIVILTEKYLIKINELEETDFFVSSKVLFAASLLLRIKSEILLNKHIKSIDEVLFGEKEKESVSVERIELDEEVPNLIPRSPMPRFKKVTLPELMEALNKAIVTENRRIRKVMVNRNALRETEIMLPKKNVNISSEIKKIHTDLLYHFNENKDEIKISYTKFIGSDKKKRIMAFQPLLHLEHQKKIWLDQDSHFEEIYIWLKPTYLKHNPDPFADLKREVEEKVKN